MTQHACLTTTRTAEVQIMGDFKSTESSGARARLDATVTEIVTPWLAVAQAADRVTRLITEIPAGTEDGSATGERFTVLKESEKSLREVAVLLQTAATVLRGIRGVEVQRFREWEGAHPGWAESEGTGRL